MKIQNLRTELITLFESFRAELLDKRTFVGIAQATNKKKEHYENMMQVIQQDKEMQRQIEELSQQIQKTEQEMQRKIESLDTQIKEQKEMKFYLETEQDTDESKIIKEKITGISIYNNEKNEVYYIDVSPMDKNVQQGQSPVDKNVQKETSPMDTMDIFENAEIKKIGIDLSRAYILLKQEGITLNGISYDIGIAAYILNPTNNKLKIDNLIEQYLELNVDEVIGVSEKKQANKQINLFDAMSGNAEQDEEAEKQKELEKDKYCLYAYAISKIKEITLKEMEEINCLDLFYNIDMPTVEVLSDMQWNKSKQFIS